jgi:hypothetical protein
VPYAHTIEGKTTKTLALNYWATRSGFGRRFRLFSTTGIIAGALMTSPSIAYEIIISCRVVPVRLLPAGAQEG